MKILRYFILFFVLFIVNTVNAAEYSEGQVWKYKTRKGEEKSLLYIIKIEESKNTGKIYHIYIDFVKIKNPNIFGGVQKQLPHVPVNEKALNESVTKLVSTGKKIYDPDISAGYQSWRESFDNGDTGVFDIPVSKILRYVEETIAEMINQQR